MYTLRQTFSNSLRCALLGAAFLFVAPAMAQSEQQPSDQEIATHYSLYFEDFKNENYQSALPNLRWILENAPGFPNDSDRNFRRAIEAFEGLAEQDPAYLDSALVIFETAVPKLRAADVNVDEQRWLINKGRFIQSNAAHFSNAQAQAAEAYMEAYELDASSLDAYYVNYLINHVHSLGDEEATLSFIDRVEETHGDVADVAEYIAVVQNTLFDTPEERVAFIERQVERNPDDADLIAELFDLYITTGRHDMAEQLSERLLEVQPDARTFQLVARMRLEDGDARGAYQLYERALQTEGVEGRERDIYFNMGIAQQQIGNLQNARRHFRQALEIDSNFGAAYIAIGDLYVTQVGNCGSFDREDRAVYWLAVDYYERAASRDPSVASQARQKARSYSGSFPSSEDLFFRGWSVGDTYQVNYGCYSWIGESTTVRRP